VSQIRARSLCLPAVVGFMLLGFAVLVLPHIAGGALAAFTPVGPSAIWNPDAAAMAAIREKCASFGPPKLKECFIAAMRDAGALSDAIAFTTSFDGVGILRGFRKVGPVDIAFMSYPFRANENEGCLLVNGAPPLVDIDALQNLPQEEMKSDPTYRELAKRFPEAMLFAGDRAGMDYPVIEELPDGGKRFIASYRLKNKCRACELIGMVRFGFDFDASGIYLGARFIDITKADGSGLESHPAKGAASRHDNSARIRTNRHAPAEHNES
jgi:hypothetical protein